MNKQKYAFTLVELIVVITILAILWTIAFISLQWYSKDARDSIRISDVSNMKTSLELFHLNSWKYPLPDDNQIADYWTEILWYQWDFWTSVISSLSRSISEVPTDPLTDKKYVFSVANNKNEFEILSLLEWDSVVLNNISQTNAASLEVTPKIDWTYNRVFIKTASYIVPVPSIINTEVWATTMTLDSSNISSQVINWWENIPEQWNVISNTWALTWLALSVYTWSIDINTSNTDKETVIQKIKDAYTGSILASNDIYNYILSSSWELENVALVNSIVLKDDTTEITVVPDPYSSCTGINTPTPFSATTIYDSCDIPDIIICDWLKSWITISWCNVWASTWSEYNLCVDIASCTIARSWELFQWWNNTGLKNASTSSTQIWATTDDSTYNWSIFISGPLSPPYDWTSIPNDELWWYTTDTFTSRKWPCVWDYHVPSSIEWSALHTTWWWGWAWWTAMSNDLKLPITGSRSWSTANFDYTGQRWYYWSSTPTWVSPNSRWINMYFHPTLINPVDTTYRAAGFSVRCFKN